MDKKTLWSLRLGYSAKQANTIKKYGLNKFLKQSFATKVDSKIPDFLNDSPKSFQELKEIRKTLNTANPQAKKEMLRKDVQTSFTMKAWWIKKMNEDEFPLREKIDLFLA